ncbi:ABC transporter permease [Nemorincola caseinilytica]|uniref:Transport permease protein n=1 Tax=Nemorincola caseinilytica TaxID=2054315 RepID=A0ABP8N9F5_9BACT
MSVTTADNEKWDINISSKTSLLDIDIKEIWRYRDLLVMFIIRDVVTRYKQTILGPLWFMLQPILTAVIYTLIFSRIARISTNDTPPILFYLGSLTLWNYFSETFGIISKTFTENANVLGKVYFPRLVLPLSKAISGIMKMLMQFVIFFGVLIYHVFVTHKASPNWYALTFPLLLIVIALFSMGAGLLITALTSKYRDLSFLVVFGIQLYMYLTPVIYPLSIASPDKQVWLWLNPLTAIFEAFKYSFLGANAGQWNNFWLGYSLLFTLVMFLVGLIMFNKVEKKFIDVI